MNRIVNLLIISLSVSMVYPMGAALSLSVSDDAPIILRKKDCIKGPREFVLIPVGKSEKGILKLEIDADSNAKLLALNRKNLLNLSLREAEKKWGTLKKQNTRVLTNYFLFETSDRHPVKFEVALNRKEFIYAFRIHIEDVGDTFGQIEGMNYGKKKRPSKTASATRRRNAVRRKLRNLEQRYRRYTSDQVLASYRKRIEDRPKDLKLRYEFGLLLYGYGKYKDAVVEFRKVVRQEPKGRYALLIVELYNMEIEETEFKKHRRDLRKYMDNELLREQFNNLS